MEVKEAGVENVPRGRPTTFVEEFFDPCASIHPTIIDGGKQAWEGEEPSELKRSETEDNAFGSRPINPAECVLTLLCCAVPSLIVVILFSDIGAGIETYSSLLKMQAIGGALVSFGFFLMFICYILDVSEWSSKCKTITAIGIMYILFIGGILQAREQPVAPIVVLLFHTPILLAIQRFTVSSNVYKNQFYLAISVCCIVVSVALTVTWLSWVMGGNGWNDESKNSLISRSEEFYSDRGLNHTLHCGPDKIEVDEEQELINTKQCAKAKTGWWLVWIGPGICAAVLFMIGCISGFRAKSLEDKSTGKAEAVVRVGVITFMILLMCMWVSAGIAGASMRLQGTLMAFVMGFGFGMFIWLYFELGRANIIAAANKSKMVRSVIEFATSDWARAFFILCVNMFIPMTLVINAVNQCVRKCRGKAQTKGCYTENFSKKYELMKQWNWYSIFTKVNILAIVYFVLMIGVAKATYIFLSWLNGILVKLDLGLVIIIFFIIGYCMFMLPPVPGVPVYITGGIILAARCQTTSLGFWGGTILSIVIGYTLKLTAVMGQWAIGRKAGNSVKIQKMVGVDTVAIRAIEDILKRPGLSLPKVGILVGGPDWPTSVLCGILKLNVFQCVLGTMPCICIATPCCLVGAFLLRAGENSGGAWGAIATTTLAIASLGQGGAGMVAAYYMTAVMNEKGDELAKPRPEHKPIEDMTKAEQAFVEMHAKVTQWDNMKGGYKTLLKFGTAVNMFSFFILVWGDKHCFRPFSLTSKINDPYSKDGLRAPGEEHGSAFNIVLFPGAVAVLLFLIACICLKLVMRWAGKEAQKQLAAVGNVTPTTKVDDC